MGAVVDIFNSWSAISYILSNQRTHGGEAGEALVREVTAEMRDRATETLACTRQKLSEFRKPDGSFSYTKCASAKISAGMPVAVPDTNEGDVNATIICSSELLYYIYAALELIDYAVPIFGAEHMAHYCDLLNASYERAYGKKTGIIKTD